MLVVPWLSTVFQLPLLQHCRYVSKRVVGKTKCSRVNDSKIKRASRQFCGCRGRVNITTSHNTRRTNIVNRTWQYIAMLVEYRASILKVAASKPSCGRQNFLLVRFGIIYSRICHPICIKVYLYLLNIPTPKSECRSVVSNQCKSQVIQVATKDEQIISTQIQHKYILTIYTKSFALCMWHTPQHHISHALTSLE
jgi:hypothetical protein